MVVFWRACCFDQKWNVCVDGGFVLSRFYVARTRAVSCSQLPELQLVMCEVSMANGRAPGGGERLGARERHWRRVLRLQPAGINTGSPPALPPRLTRQGRKIQPKSRCEITMSKNMVLWIPNAVFTAS